MTFCDDLIGTLGAVAVGSVLAGLVALCLSPLAPLGPVRPFLRVEVHADWAVIGVGVAGLLLSLGAIAALASFRAVPGRARDQWPASLLVTRDDRGGAGRTAAAGGHRRAVRPRARGGQERRPRAVGHPGRHSRRHRRRGHGHVRVESQHLGQPPGALRLELDLRHGRWWRARRRPRTGCGQACSTQTPSSRVGAASTTRPCKSTGSTCR